MKPLYNILVLLAVCICTFLLNLELHYIAPAMLSVIMINIFSILKSKKNDEPVN